MMMLIVVIIDSMIFKKTVNITIFRPKVPATLVGFLLSFYLWVQCIINK